MYHENMLNQKFCVVPGCQSHAVSFRDVCYNHIEDVPAYIEELRVYFDTHTKIIGLNLAYVLIQDVDLRDKMFLQVDFNHCIFRNVVSRNFVLHMCFLDYSVWESSKLIGSKHTNCVFSGARMTDTTIEDANMLQNNFNYCVLKNVAFTGSDLYNSRFLSSRLEDTSFHDCNLKNVDFRYSARQNVSFKYSNFQNALFEEKDGT